MCQLIIHVTYIHDLLGFDRFDRLVVNVKEFEIWAVFIEVRLWWLEEEFVVGE